MEIKDRALQLLNKEYKKDKCIEVLKKEYPGTIIKDLETAWRQAKEVMCAPKIKDYLSVPYSGSVVSQKEKRRLKELNMSKKEDIKPSKLKVIRKEIEVQGEHAIYIVTQDRIKVDGEEFKNLEEVVAYEKREIDAFARRMLELKAVFEYM